MTNDNLYSDFRRNKQMIRTKVNLKELMPINREKAAIIAKISSKYSCTLTLECDSIVLNVKSLIGLLSQSIPKDGNMWLVADGHDEELATSALLTMMSTHQ